MNNENKFIQFEKPIELKDIKEIEEKFGFSLPEEVQRHYLKYNGGCPERYLYLKDDITFVVNEFLPIKYGNEKGQLEHYYKDLVLEEKIIPKYMIPFAVDPSGDVFCFSIRHDELAAVYIWRHEKSTNSNGNLLYLCSSFEIFINEMKEDQ